MRIAIEPAPFTEIADEVRAHWAGLPSAIESLLEDHIVASTYYQRIAGGWRAGFAPIHGDGSIARQVEVEAWDRGPV